MIMAKKPKTQKAAEAPETKEEQKHKFATVVINDGNPNSYLRVRKEKSLDSEVVAMLMNRAEVEYYPDKSDDEWLCVEQGYALKQFLEIGG